MNFTIFFFGKKTGEGGKSKIRDLVVTVLSCDKKILPKYPISYYFYATHQLIPAEHQCHERGDQS